MPRMSSVSKKYFPALSRTFSFDWSHRRGGAGRNPTGGGPAGRAFRTALDEKKATDRPMVWLSCLWRCIKDVTFAVNVDDDGDDDAETPAPWRPRRRVIDIVLVGRRWCE